MDIEPINSLRWLGIVSIAVAVLAVFVLIYIYRTKRSTSISAYLAANKPTFYTMGSILSLCSLVFYVFVIGWLGPVYNVGPQILYAAMIGASTAVIAMFVPIRLDSTGFGHFMHMGTAAVSGLTLPAIVIMVLMGGEQVGVVSMVIGIIMVVFATVFLLAYILSRRLRQNVFVVEVAYILIFILTITALTLLI